MDASNFAIGGGLFQKEGELDDPIAFTGWKMKPAELNHPVREQELLAIMHALRVSRVAARWFNELAESQPLFKWIPGETNTVADALLRKPDFEREPAQVSLQELLDAARNREIVATIRTNKVTVAQTAKTMYSWNKDLQWIIKKLTRGEDVPKYSLQDGILYYQTGEDETPRLCIPDDEDMNNRVICENHDARYVNTCEMCQRNKPRQTKPPGLLQPLDIRKGRWTDISMDFVVSLSISTNGNNAIIVIVDRLTKREKVVAMKIIYATTDITDVFMKNYVKDHGLSKTIVSDRDTQFTSKLWPSIVKALGTHHNLSSAFRPQTDGHTERTNRFIGDYIRGAIILAQNDWDDYLHLAEFSYNRRWEFTKLEKSVREFLLRQETQLKVAQDRMSEAQQGMKYYYDKNILVQNFEVNDMVLLDGKNLDIRHKGYAQSKKLAPRYIGPFPVLKKILKDSYELGISKGLKLHPVFHTSLLKPYRKDPKRRQQVNKVVLAGGTEGQLVEAAIGHRKYKGKPQYKIWWLGESKAQATWEPVENLNQIPGLIDLYWRRRSDQAYFQNRRLLEGTSCDVVHVTGMDCRNFQLHLFA
ncbi:unnamed protein product [Phytophthora fragariaefolia]|uniref:Unnamed protein product n=1 Tax=Phytophthora fragariaefolia TaxID=1490495 RepID=A0A9W6X254_9STRA|nr:unnamed protein product [Phytophthora fragariaefolia]